MMTGSRSGQRRLIIASNRGPVEHNYDRNGVLRTKRGAGGMVTALQPAASYAPPEGFIWIAVAMTDAEREIAERQEHARREAHPDALSEGVISANGHKPSRRPSRKQERPAPPMRFVNVPLTAYQRYYDGISNRILWFLQHYLWNTAEEPTFTSQHYHQWEQGYKLVNQAIADVICEEVVRDPSPALVWIQDYHLYLVPGMVRERLEEAGRAADTFIHHFIHIPWPSARYWQLLPRHMLMGIYHSLLANDLIGFQTRRDSRNFIAAVRVLLEDTEVKQDMRGGRILWQGHTTLARSEPISIDVQEVREEAARGTRQYEAEVRAMLGKFTIVRVDRVEPIKNIVRGFQAFEGLLKAHPELTGEVKFLAFLVPSRQGLPSYRRYEREVRKIIQKINTTYGTDDWKPIEAFFENNRARALAAMRYYDVLLVNSVIDGMNLVAKEGPVVNESNGVLILSETAGTAQQLGEASITITPTDVEETTQALIRAMEMPSDERRQRAQLLRALVEGEDLEDWLNQQFQDIEEAQGQQPASALN
ncbi:MAG TPA: trehalose-6-phosphate synthase [Ktedonobacterales bacterium]|nr:trehalose-6-phosphate synthase [Ktedonobacterales bacterium]